MSIALKDLRARDVVDLPVGETHTLRFDGVLVADGPNGTETFVTGPVDLAKHHTLPFSGVNPRTGLVWVRQGVGLHAVYMDGQVVDKLYRSVSMRFLQQVKADLESGSYMTTEYEITPVGDPPETTYQVVRRPIPTA